MKHMTICDGSCGRTIKHAAKGVILHQGKILFLRLNEAERKIKKHDEWHLPGGQRDDEHTPIVNAVFREVEEETGITDLQVGREVLIGEWHAKDHEQPVHIIAHFFSCRLMRGKKPVTIQLSHEHDDLVWLDKEDIAQYAVAPESLEAAKMIFAESTQRFWEPYYEKYTFKSYAKSKTNPA